MKRLLSCDSIWCTYNVLKSTCFFDDKILLHLWLLYPHIDFTSLCMSCFTISKLQFNIKSQLTFLICWKKFNIFLCITIHCICTCCFVRSAMLTNWGSLTKCQRRDSNKCKLKYVKTLKYMELYYDYFINQEKDFLIFIRSVHYVNSACRFYTLWNKLKWIADENTRTILSRTKPREIFKHVGKSYLILVKTTANWRNRRNAPLVIR